MTATHILLLLIWFVGILSSTSFCANVIYDHRALVVDGKRRLLISGSIHYPRSSTPEMWPELIQKAKDGRLNVIETYIFWNKHEPTNFAAPSGSNPVAIDFTGMGKGEAWVNGQSIGRFWPTYIAPNDGCIDTCNYTGNYNSNKCLKNCGKPSQSLYHVPRSWLKPSGNILVLFEEIGGDPTQITFATRQIGSLCAHISESHPPPVDSWNPDTESGRKLGPVLSLQCPNPDQIISSIKFASFGTPQGTCGNFNHGRCKSERALSILQKACVGSRNCSIGVSIDTFGDPCFGVIKSLAVEAVCT